MLKRVLSMTAMAALAVAGTAAAAHAQQDQPTSTAGQTQAGNYMEVENAARRVEKLGMTVDQLEDRNVIGANGETIGEIDEVLSDAQGNIVAVSLEVGGFLGIGDKEVVVDLDDLEQQGDQLRLSMNEQEVESLPAWDD